MNNDITKRVVIVLAVLLIAFIGADFWTGKAVTIKGTVETTDMNVSTSMNNDDDYHSSRTTISYSALVSTNENMGMPVTVSISSGQYKTLKYGDEVSVEISRGGITNMTHYTKLR